MSVLLDGATQYGTAPIVVPTDEGTYSCFFKASFLNIGDANVIADTNSARHQLWYDATNNRYTDFIDGRSDTWLATFSTGVWIHVALAWKKSTDRMDVYQNGTLLANDGRGGVWGSSAAATQVTIGALFSHDSGFWNGSLAEFSIYSVALADLDVLSLATGTPPELVQSDSLQNHWKLKSAGVASRGGVAMTFPAGATFNSADDPYQMAAGPFASVGDYGGGMVGRAWR